MCGTPCWSRRTVTGAESPERWMSPSSCGRAALAAERSHRRPAPVIRTSATTSHRAVKKMIRGHRRLRRGRALTGIETRWLRFSDVDIGQQQDNAVLTQLDDLGLSATGTVLDQLANCSVSLNAWTCSRRG